MRPGTPPASTEPRITVVDDSAEMRDIVRDILEPAGYHVSTLAGGVSQIEELAVSRPDLIILDLVPGWEPGDAGGWDYLRQIRSHPRLRSVPVLVCSADVHALRARVEEIDRDSTLDLLEKPFTLTDLETSVAEMVSASRLPVWDDDRDIILVADAQAKLVDASSAALALLGTRLDQLRTLSVGDIVAQGAEWAAREWERYQATGHWEGPVTLRSLDGRQVPATSRAEIVKSAGTEWHVSRLELQTPESAAT